MVRMVAAHRQIRAACALLLALLLIPRLLTPAGFMPAFEQGHVSIVACPDFDPPATASGHHHKDSKTAKVRQPCPFAAASAPATFAGPSTVTVAAGLFGSAPLFRRAFAYLERHRDRDRPPLRGPPIPA